MFSLFILLFVVIVCEESVLKISSTRREIDSHNILFLKDSYEISSYDINHFVSYSGKLCNQTNLENIYFNCIIKYEGYNRYWIVLIDDKELLSALIRNKTSNINSVIINNETIKNYTFEEKIFPVFSVDPRIYNELTEYEIGLEKDNIFINIFYLKYNLDTNSFITFIISISLAILILLTAIIWHIYTWRIYRNEQGLQKTFSVILYLKFLISLLLIYYMYFSMQTISLDNISDTILRVYVETVIVTIGAVLKTLFWFVIILISYGWQIHRGLFTRRELRKLVLYFVLLYILICFDQIFDLLVPYKFYKLQASDVKNILLFIILTILIIFFTIKSKKILSVRYNYAYNFAREYMQSIATKIKMMKMHLIATIIYCFLILTFIFVLKMLLKEYICDQYYLVIDNLLDFIGLCFFLFIYRPRRLPHHFNIFYDNLGQISSDFNIYEVRLNINNDFINNHIFDKFINPLNKRDERTAKSNDYPIIIINPIINETSTDDKYINNRNIIDKISLGMRVEK